MFKLNATSKFRNWQPSLVGLGVYLYLTTFLTPTLLFLYFLDN